MHATDFNAYTYSAAVYCVGCLPSYAHQVGDEPRPIFASDEMDYYPTCCICHAQHDYVNLTDDGRREIWRKNLPEEWQKETENGRSLDAYAWPGGYPLYYSTRDGMTICHKCANKIDTSDIPAARDVNWEDTALDCDDCGERIEPAYGEE